MSDQGRQNNGGAQNARWAEDFFIYTVAFGNLAPAASSQQQLQIQADSNFEWIESTVYGNLHGQTPPFTDNILLPISVTITDSGSGRQLFSQGVPISSFAGNGKQPFILPTTRLFMSKSVVSFTALNFDAASTFDNLYLNLIGRKLFDLNK